jgi:hypothetical protein
MRRKRRLNCKRFALASTVNVLSAPAAGFSAKHVNLG